MDLIQVVLSAAARSSVNIQIPKSVKHFDETKGNMEYVCPSLQEWGWHELYVLSGLGPYAQFFDVGKKMRMGIQQKRKNRGRANTPEHKIRISRYTKKQNNKPKTTLPFPKVLCSLTKQVRDFSFILAVTCPKPLPWPLPLIRMGHSAALGTQDLLGYNSSSSSFCQVITHPLKHNKIQWLLNITH